MSDESIPFYEVAMNAHDRIAALEADVASLEASLIRAREEVVRLRVERDGMRRLVSHVADAWTNPGPAPMAHEHAKARLAGQWPTLWNAVRRLAEETNR